MSDVQLYTYQLCGNTVVESVVTKDSQIDPATETLLYSDELADGMVVLPDAQKRVDPENVGVAAYTVLRENRFCVVNKIRIVGREMYFIGTYADGTQHRRLTYRENAWVVKKDSISGHICVSAIADHIVCEYGVLRGYCKETLCDGSCEIKGNCTCPCHSTPNLKDDK